MYTIVMNNSCKLSIQWNLMNHVWSQEWWLLGYLCVQWLMEEMLKSSKMTNFERKWPVLQTSINNLNMEYVLCISKAGKMENRWLQMSLVAYCLQVL